MALPANTGYLDESIGVVLPNNTGTWANSSATWANWRVWATAPADPMTYVSEVVDLGQTRSYTLKIVTDASGTVSYDVYTSDTGLFAGEETVTNIAANSSGIASFNSRYYAVAVNVSNTSGNPVLRGFEMTASEATVSFDYNSLNTSTLSGTSSARTLVLPRTVSQIVDMQIQPHASSYTMDVYVTDYPTATTLVPRIVSKSISTPQIALVGLDNVARDGVVDIQIRALPEQYMDGNNLLVR